MDKLSRLIIKMQTQQPTVELERTVPKADAVPAVAPLQTPRPGHQEIAPVFAQSSLQRALNGLDLISDQTLSLGKITPVLAGEIRSQYEEILGYLASSPSVIIEETASTDDKNRSIGLLIDQLNKGDFELSSPEVLDTHKGILQVLQEDIPPNTLQSYGLVSSQFHLYAFNMAPRGHPIAVALMLSPAEYSSSHENEVQTFCRQADSRYHEFIDQVETGKVIAKKNKLIANLGISEIRQKPAKKIAGAFPDVSYSEKAKELVKSGIWSGLALEAQAHEFKNAVRMNSGQINFFGLEMPTEEDALVRFFQEARWLSNQYLVTLKSSLLRKDRVTASSKFEEGPVEVARHDSDLRRAIEYLVLGSNTNTVLAYGLHMPFSKGTINFNDFTKGAADYLASSGAFRRNTLTHTLLLAMNDYSTTEQQHAHHVAALPEGYLTEKGISQEELIKREKELTAIANASDTFEELVHLAALSVKKKNPALFPFTENDVIESFNRYKGIAREILRLEGPAIDGQAPLFNNVPGYGDIKLLL